MLFHVTWEFSDSTEAGSKRSLEVFAKWQPPAGVEFKGFYGFSDGTGGAAIMEVENAAALFEATAPWTPWLRFDVTPIVPIEESTRLANAAVAFRESVS